jgi:hypothetical protein
MGGTTLLVAVIALGIGLLISLLVFGSGPNSTSPHGLSNPLRSVFFRPNGTWRRFGRAGAVCALVAMLLLAALASLRHVA